MTATMTMNAPTIDLSKPFQMATFSIVASRAAELAAEGKMVPWQGVIVVEGVPTGDRRIIELGALKWATLPLPLMAQFENPVGGQGHDGAVLAGRIDDIVRVDGDRVWARGMIDPASPGGPNLINALDKGLMRGVSVDLDDILVTQFRDNDGNQQRGIAAGRIRGATVTPFQAIVQAEISLDMDSLVASDGPGDGPILGRVTTPISPEESFIETHSAALVASGKIPVDPPLSWFDKRKFDQLTDLTITADGRIFGHIAAWGTCHISFRKCVPVPRSNTNYSEFRKGKTLTADGVEVHTGPLIMDSVHPDLLMQASDSQAFYAHTGSAVADIIPYEDKFGIAIVGAIRPDVRPEQLRALRGSDVSPDWRNVNGYQRECVAMLAVNNSGFKVPKTLVASAGRFVTPGGVAAAIDPDGEVLALVASGHAMGLDAEPFDDDDVCEECDDDLGAELTSYAVAEIDREFASALVIERFGPKVRRFRCAEPRKVRVFGSARPQFVVGVSEEFHGNHNQKSHGRRYGGRSGAFIPNDADIEMAELESAAAGAAAVTSDKAPPLDKKVRRHIAESAADRAWYGGSLYEAVTDGVADEGIRSGSDIKITSAEFDDVMMEASGILREREAAEAREMEAQLGPRKRRRSFRGG